MHDDAALISVVIATNRVSRYFDEALASCAEQTYSNVEVIVVDNGAADAQAIEDAVRARIPDAAVIRRPVSNLAIARNVGVDRARGVYVAFLDDDDRWHPDRLCAQAHALETRPAAVASYCGMRVIDESGDVLIEADQIEVDRLGIARRDTGIISPNLFARRDALVQAGGSQPQNRLSQDLGLVLSLAELGPFVFVDRPLVDYRAHASNDTMKHRELVRSIEHTLRFHLWAAKERGDRPLASAYRESLRRNARYAWWRAARSAKASLRARQPAAAASEIVWALRAEPAGLLDGLWRRAVRRTTR
jgi:glycosyltransferase involved in cell wall biosynthesis